MSILDNIQQFQTFKYTENGATAFDSTGNDLLDLFAECGSMRYRYSNDIANMYYKALINDKTLATKLAFYTRDVRGGLGERDTARVMFQVLAKYYPNIIVDNINNIPNYGRYDDLLCLIGTNCEELAINTIANQLQSDLKNMQQGNPISLLAKWLPSINTSSYKTRILACKLCKKLNLSPKQYRKTLSSLRAYTNVTEVRMSDKDYSLIKYDQVPSYAMHRYAKAFDRNDSVAFNEYLTKLQNGKTKINASTLFPYDIVKKYFNGYSIGTIPKDNDILEAQWRALPNYVEGDNKFLIMADVSGSMYGQPLATSIGLALYFAERNKGAFANKFMTFTSNPKLVEIKGDNLFQKIKYISNAEWGGSTNLESAFNLVLNTAIRFNTPSSDMPTSIVVISDMEIDTCSDIDNWSFYDAMKARFESNGYQIPNIVFWNVNARRNTFHASQNTKGVQLASGQSPAVFKSLINGLNFTPYEYMCSVLNSPRYDSIIVNA